MENEHTPDDAIEALRAFVMSLCATMPIGHCHQIAGNLAMCARTQHELGRPSAAALIQMLADQLMDTVLRSKPGSGSGLN